MKNPLNTLYSAVAELINSYKLGETYTSESFKDALEDITRSRRQHLKHNGQWYRVRTYQTYLKRAGILTNVRRGVWRVNYHVPSWMTLYALETIMGYKNYTLKENRDENGRWLGSEYVMRDPAFQNELKERLKTYKQRIDKDGVTSESTSDETHNSAASVYKTGMKVTLISTRSSFYDQAEYFIRVDGLKVGETYTVDEMTNNGHYPGQWFITTEEGNQYHIPYDCFELYVPKSKTKKLATPEGWKVGDKFYVMTPNPNYYYIIKEIKTNGEVIIVTSDDGKEWGSNPWYIAEINNLFEISTWIHKTESKQDTKNINRVTCIDAGGYRRLTVGKEYEVLDEENDYYVVSNDLGTPVTMLKYRFRQEQDTEKTTTKTWKVGDLLTESLLNDHPHNFYGYSDKWESLTPGFVCNRTIEEIADIAGKKAAKISGTCNIWIEIASIDKDMNASVAEDRLPGFLTELEALIAKYK